MKFSIKKFVFVILALLALTLGSLGSNPVSAIATPSGQWTWVDGPNSIDQPGYYDIEDTPSAYNQPGGRINPTTWTDASGNLWLFGGYGRDSEATLGYLNDLWRFDPTSGLWTWADGAIYANKKSIYGTQGVPAIANVPAARFDATSWIDSAGKLWLFGGQGWNSSGGPLFGALNDLWKFDPVTGQWTWVNGSQLINQNGVYGIEDTPSSSNIPGARRGAQSWIDSQNNLWLFGGLGGSGYLNDLWKFDPISGQWTWVDGANTANAVGVYGSEDVAADSNTPGARYYSTGWKDSSGNLWLFGGYTSALGAFNDMWKFNPTSEQWTWVNGSNLPNQIVVYGSEDVPAVTNHPGAMYGLTSLIDDNGYVWLFGGLQYPLYLTNGLWRFDPASEQWAWIDGSNTTGALGVYGTEDVPAATNVPGARDYSAAWIDNANDLWLFGGNGYDTVNTTGYLNDLWKFSTAPLTTTSISSGAEDGFILESGEKSKKGGTKNNKASTFNLGDNAAKKQYLGILSFNTTLPANAIITKVTLKFKKAGVIGGGNPVKIFGGFIAQIKQGTFGTAPLAISDFQAAANASTTAVKPALVSGWYSLDLTSVKAYINAAGVTQIRLRFKLDDNNNLIANYLKLYSGNSTAANAPQLIIEYLP